MSIHPNFARKLSKVSRTTFLCVHTFAHDETNHQKSDPTFPVGDRHRPCVEGILSTFQ